MNLNLIINLYLNLKDYELKGNNILNKFNINEDDKIILFQNRDDGFLNYIDRNKDWSYHNYRDSDPKNDKINDIPRRQRI